jgi:hypothetical protein
LRRLRIVASAQLSLVMGAEGPSASFWDLPETTQLEVLGLLGRLIARGVVEEDIREVPGE